MLDDGEKMGCAARAVGGVEGLLIAEFGSHTMHSIDGSPTLCKTMPQDWVEGES